LCSDSIPDPTDHLVRAADICGAPAPIPASLLRYDWPVGNELGRLLFSNPASPRRRDLTVRVSRDDGKTWPVSRTLHEGPAAYSCLTVLPGKSIGCLYECGRRSPYEKLSFASFPLEWLERGN